MTLGNIAQGGDPLQASVDQKWSCRGQIKPILMRFFAKSPFPDGIGERLFFGPLIFTFLGVRETFFRRLRHFSRNSVPFPGIRCYHQFIIFYQQSPLNDNTTTMIHCFQLSRTAQQVTLSLTHSLSHSLTEPLLIFDIKEQSQTLLTFETFGQRDGETRKKYIFTNTF